MDKQTVIAVAGVIAGLGGTCAMTFAPGLFPTMAPYGFWGGTTLTVLGLVLLTSSLRPNKEAKYRWVPMWSFSASFRDKLPFRPLIPLKVAVQEALEALEGRMASEAARQLGVTPESYMANALARDDVPLWGTRPNSKRLIRLPDGEAGRVRFLVDQNATQRHGSKSPDYENIHILRRDVRQRIKSLKDWG